MSCSCGHDHHGGHHHHHHGAMPSGAVPVTLNGPLVAMEGRLICADAAQMMVALSLLPDHVGLSRAEAGCLRFDLWQDDDPLIWHLSELFASEEAFAAHQARTKTSEWGSGSGDIRRDFQRSHVEPWLRSEAGADAGALDGLLAAAFGGDAETRLVQALRADGDLTQSVVAEAAGCLLGHVALSPLTADRGAFALAPVAVHPAVQGRGLGKALVEQALDRAGDAPVVVLGDPGYYARFGFRPAELASPYAGPHLLIRGDLPAGSVIAHARAFAAL